MRLIAITSITLAVAALTGYGLTAMTLAERPPTGAVSIGPWRAWPQTGTPDIDPYARAIVARTGALPLGAGEGMELVAEQDSDGGALSGDCIYDISGLTPEARIWTIGVTPLSLTGRSRATPRSDPLAPPSAFTSEGLLRDAMGEVHIVASATPQPGDWLALPKGSRFRLTLRLYDSPTGFATRPRASARLMPQIRRRQCS